MKRKLKAGLYAAATTGGELELLVYDSIGANYWGGGVTAEKVQQQLKDAGDVSKIKLRINSPGGDVFEGSAIYSLLAQHPAEVECYVDGLAASAAFTVAMAADKIHISESAMMMLHNAWGMCVGYAEDMKKTADVLDKVSGTMRDIYSKRSGMSADEVQTLMDDETWMTADEAVEYGFADDTVVRNPAEDQDDQELAASFDLSKFAKKNPRAEKKTKRVDGEDLEKSAFAYRPDDKLENWKLPIKFSTDEKTKKHIRNAISRWSSTDMPDAAEKSAARGRIKSAAKANDIDVSDDSLASAWTEFFADPEDGDREDANENGCMCECANCGAGDCEGCTNAECDDPNCEDCPCQMSAAASAENEMLIQEFELLAG